MRCEHPILVPRYKNKRKQRFIKDDQIELVKVPCGKCEVCQSNRRLQWAFRFSQELKYCLFQSFVTLTYDDEHVGDNKLDSSHPQKLFKFLRNHYRDEKAAFKYMCVGEHGDSFGRIHWHFIFCARISIPLLDFMNLVQQNWPYGNVFFGSVTIRSIMYVAKYCIKDLREDAGVVVLLSKEIGEKWIALNRDYLKRNLILYGTEEDGKKIGLPRCWKNKIFTRQEYDEALDYFRGSLEDEERDYRQDFYNTKNSLKRREIYKNTRKQKLLHG